MWPEETRTAALELIGKGMSDREVARVSGVPRVTVGAWRRKPGRTRRFFGADPDWRPASPTRYCYVLGMYLGDGCITTVKASAFLQITLDALYDRLVAEAQNALGELFPTRSVGRYRHPVHRKVVLQVTSASLPYAFPQHGPGKKHLREIRLVDWQLELTRAYPEHLLRGLIHSDGSRCINRFDTTLPSGRIAHYEYPRYFFTNYSSDIRRIFCDHCDLLGIRWTQSSFKNMSVAHCDSVALLDAFVGPKR